MLSRCRVPLFGLSVKLLHCRSSIWSRHSGLLEGHIPLQQNVLLYLLGSETVVAMFRDILLHLKRHHCHR